MKPRLYNGRVHFSCADGGTSEPRDETQTETYSIPGQLMFEYVRFDKPSFEAFNRLLQQIPQGKFIEICEAVALIAERFDTETWYDLLASMAVIIDNHGIDAFDNVLKRAAGASKDYRSYLSTKEPDKEQQLADSSHDTTHRPFNSCSGSSKGSLCSSTDEEYDNLCMNNLQKRLDSVKHECAKMEE